MTKNFGENPASRALAAQLSMATGSPDLSKVKPTRSFNMAGGLSQQSNGTSAVNGYMFQAMMLG